MLIFCTPHPAFCDLKNHRWLAGLRPPCLRAQMDINTSPLPSPNICYFCSRKSHHTVNICNLKPKVEKYGFLPIHAVSTLRSLMLKTPTFKCKYQTLHQICFTNKIGIDKPRLDFRGFLKSDLFDQSLVLPTKMKYNTFTFISISC